MPAVRGKTDERCLGAVFILVMFPSAGKCDGFCWESPGKVGEEEIASSAAELIWTLGGVKGPHSTGMLLKCWFGIFSILRKHIYVSQ